MPLLHASAERTVPAPSAAVYALLGIAAGRVPVLSRLTPIERRRVVFGPSFAGMAGYVSGGPPTFLYGRADETVRARRLGP